jgi:hypothetical protein
MADQKNPTALVEEKQSEPIIPVSPTGQERDAIGQHGQTMLQKDTFRHDDNNNNNNSDDGYGVDFQETTTPSLDSEQVRTNAHTCYTTNYHTIKDLWLLGPIREQDKGRKCLVLDLDETLVHSSFKVSTFALTDNNNIDLFLYSDRLLLKLTLWCLLKSMALFTMCLF